tara:strand:- start:566 stop:784 length:219 start_codon:yes stop_codon:yes gene_type:complete
MKATFIVDEWNQSNLTINGIEYDVNVYADNEEKVRVIITECEVTDEGNCQHQDKFIFDEAFDIGVEIKQEQG